MPSGPSPYLRFETHLLLPQGPPASNISKNEKNSLPTGYDPLPMLVIDARLRTPTPRTLSTRLPSVTSDLPSLALGTRMRRRHPLADTTPARNAAGTALRMPAVVPVSHRATLTPIATRARASLHVLWDVGAFRRGGSRRDAAWPGEAGHAERMVHLCSGRQWRHEEWMGGRWA